VLEIQTEEDKSLQIGAMVDLAREVVEINPSDIQDAPEFENLKTTASVTGIVNNRGDITLIMDIKKVFTLNELNTITSIN
jgi:purine-binding chemotaxis protein CheW